MSVIDPDLIFGNALTYTAEDIVSKLNFPAMAKKMTDNYKNLVLVRETLTSEGSAYGTLYFTGSIVGFTYENLVDIGKVEDITLLKDEAAEGVRRINELIKGASEDGTALKNNLEDTKQKLKENNSSNELDNISTDINSLNDSLKSFNNILGKYTSEAQQFTDLITQITLKTSASNYSVLTQGVYNIQSTPNQFSTSPQFLESKFIGQLEQQNPNPTSLNLPELNIPRPTSIPQSLTGSLLTGSFTATSPPPVNPTQTNTLNPPNSECPPGGTEGIKKFQDWLDSKKYKWTSKNGQLNKGSGYGNCGPSTKAAWKTYGQEYLSGTPSNTTTNNTTTNNTLTNNTTNNNTTTNTTTNNTVSTNLISPLNSECPPSGVEGTKAFQSWLDDKKYKWTSSGKPINKNGSNYGVCGDKTKAAWKTYGQEYLNETLPKDPVENVSPEKLNKPLPVIDAFPIRSNSEKLLLSNINPSRSLATRTSATFNTKDNFIIDVSKQTPGGGSIQTTIASTLVTPTTIVFSRNRDQLNQAVTNANYYAPQDIDDLDNFILTNNIKSVMFINLWSFPRENIATVALKGKVRSGTTGNSIQNAKVKFKPLLNAESRAKLDQFINKSGLGGVILEGQQNINDIITSYNNVTGSFQTLFSSSVTSSTTLL